MLIREFKNCNSVGSTYASRIPREVWDQHRAYLSELHDRGLTRQEIIRTTQREFNFRPSPGQLNIKFKEWGLKVYASNEITEYGQLGPRRRALSDQAYTESSSSSPVHQEQTQPSDLQNDTLRLKTLKAGPRQLQPSNQSFMAASTGSNNNHNFISSVSPSFNDNDIPHDAFLDFDSSFVGDATILGSQSSYLDDLNDLSTIPPADLPRYTQDPMPLPSSGLEGVIAQEQRSGVQLTLVEETDELSDLTEAQILVNAWFRRVNPCSGDDNLQATLDLAGFFSSSRLYDFAFEIYKALYYEFSEMLQPDDLLRLGALINYARFVDRSQLNEMQIVIDALKTSVDWSAEHWTSPDIRIGQQVQLYLRSLLTSLTSDSLVQGAQSNVISDFSANVEKLSRNLYHSVMKLPTSCQHMFAHTALLMDQIDPVLCPRLFDSISNIVQWGLKYISFGRLDIDSHFLSTRARDVVDKWNTIRCIALHLMEEAVDEELISRLGNSEWPCKCTVCPNLTSLARSSRSETCMALACIAYEHVDSFLFNSVQGDETILKFDARSSFVEYAIRHMRATCFKVTSPEETYKHLSILQDFLSAYRSCFESAFAMKEEKQNQFSEKSSLDVQTLLCKLHKLEVVRLQPENSKNISVSNPSVPASQWMKKLSIRSRLSGPAVDALSNTQLKRNRSALSSVLAGPTSRSSSLRSFEQFAKKLKQGSSPSIRTTRSHATFSSQASSRRSWQFDAVTGLGVPVDDQIRYPQDQAIDEVIEEEEEKVKQDRPPPYLVIDQSRRIRAQSATFSPPAYNIARSATLPTPASTWSPLSSAQLSTQTPSRYGSMSSINGYVQTVRSPKRGPLTVINADIDEWDGVDSSLLLPLSIHDAAVTYGLGQDSSSPTEKN